MVSTRYHSRDFFFISIQIKDKIDVTAWMTDFIERYPESFYEYQKDAGNKLSN